MIKAEVPAAELKAAAREIQLSLNPHPAGQVEMNAGFLEEEVVQGVQHKYRETVLFFPHPGPDLPRLLHLLLQVAAVRAA